MEETDDRFVVNNIPVTAIAVSHGQDDSGVFELSFKDERYLPFEGAGAISRWRFELQNQFRQFDYQTINDVIVHIRYTASDGGETLKSAALSNLETYVNNAEQQSKQQGLFRLFSLAHEFPNEWHQFISSSEEDRLLVLGDLKAKLPFFVKSNQINAINVVDLRLFTSQADLDLSVLKDDELQNLTSDLDPLGSFEAAADVGQLSQYVADISEEIDGFWGLQVQQANLLDLNQLRDAWLVVKYTIS
ncbi:hypothetical protein MNBD_GAMMA12-3772 [hydrothermal vent metagenome]|uniref:Tc toxin complex TcA C-terminal TcB-binding domain-containing protein n=1 Tax=hydrothermal vent metagenome TaxID=652676 RepID=A0A3B0YP71_9ZZZZ